ncbi:hypothetical protein CEP54_002470 [Fusarium duplospermum]|uniref:Uncharacterized protein n=1 Tax=Fusarium duplospermum TaxID=1325734 RepID=A0A428QUZ5_9HYPO|nr:hypothetical protein CEP54_002470 [Fusarium duplospermum]
MSRLQNDQAPDLPWIGNTAAQESRPGSPSTRRREPLPPAYALPIRAAARRAPPVLRPLPDGATPQERRAAAIRSAEYAEQAALEDLEREGEKMRARGINGWSLTKRCPNGELRVRAQQFGLESAPGDHSRVRICVTRMRNGEREVETIFLDDLPDDRDTRDVGMLNDVFTASAPHTDTIRIFPQAMGMFCRGEGKEWKPEHILGEKKKKGKVIAPMSVSQEFLVPGEQADVQSLTSHGHFIHHPAPPGIGLGWGDWDLYAEWQAHGRSVNKAWVTRGDWKPKFDEEFTFVIDNEDPSVEILGDTVPAEPVTEEAETDAQNARAHRRSSSWDGAPQTLYQKGEFAEVKQPEEVVGGNEVREVEVKEVGVEVVQTKSIEVEAEEEIKVEAVEEEEVRVEDEETFSPTPHGRYTTTTTLSAFVFISDMPATA